MALSPQQLQALFQSISAGSQVAFAGTTPDMSQDERNQWINSYDSGGTNYGDYLSWYGNQNGTSGQVGSPAPAQINTTGSYPAVNSGAPYLSSLSNPTAQSYSNTQNGTPMFNPQSYGKGGGAGAQGRGVWNPNAVSSGQGGVGLGSAGFNQVWTPGSGNGANNPFAVAPATMGGTPTAPPSVGGGGGITPPTTGTNPPMRARPKGYSFVSGGWSQPSPWGNTQWH